MSTIESARITFPTLGPRTDMIASARITPGNAIMLSITRISGLSSRLKNPASMPMHVPAMTTASETPRPTISETWLPLTTRL